jgi:hypothetical protein
LPIGIADASPPADIWSSSETTDTSGAQPAQIATFAAEIATARVRVLMLYYIVIDAREDLPMRTTVTIDDELYRRALEVADPGMDKANLFREAMKVFVRVQAAKRLSALGGRAPKMKPIPRRQPA